MGNIDTGDTVFHRPTGETWVVACVRDSRLSWIGWPEGHAELSDCELKEKATPEKRMAELQRIAASPNDNDHRVRYARWVLEQETSKAE